MTEDTELLRRYSRDRSNAAFADLVSRYVDLVYSAALRQVNGDTHLAKDVAQTVFVDLARKAPSLVNRGLLAGRLYTSTRYAASHAVRAEQRRKVRHREAQIMHEQSFDPGASVEWEKLSPFIDDAMCELSERDRAAVLLRHFEGRTFSEAGAKLGLSEEAIRKRVTRAMESLRESLAKKGITSTSAALILMLGEHAVKAAPTGLISSIAVASAAVGGSVWYLTIGAKVAASLATLGLASAGLLWQSAASTRLRNELVDSKAETQTILAELAPSGKLRLEIGALESQLASARNAEAGIASTANLQRGNETGAATQRTADPRVANDAARQEQRALGFRSTMDRSYARLFRHLNLPPSQLDQFKDLMVAKFLAGYETTRWVRESKVPLHTHSDNVAVSNAGAFDILEKMRLLVGDDNLAYYKSYDETLNLRQPLLLLSNQLDSTDSPLTDQQADRLISLLVASFATLDEAFSTGLPNGFPESIKARAQSILNPAQWVAYQEVDASKRALAQLRELNREAARKGLLRLTEQSLKDYPPPPDSPATKALPVDRNRRLNVPVNSFVSISMTKESIPKALNFYKDLSSKQLTISPEVTASSRTVSIEIKDMTPLAAASAIKDVLAKQAGVSISTSTGDVESVDLKALPSLP